MILQPLCTSHTGTPLTSLMDKQQMRGDFGPSDVQKGWRLVTKE